MAAVWAQGPRSRTRATLGPLSAPTPPDHLLFGVKRRLGRGGEESHQQTDGKKAKRPPQLPQIDRVRRLCCCCRGQGGGGGGRQRWGGGGGEALARPRQAQCSCQFPGTPTCLRQPRAPEALKGTATLSRLRVGGVSGGGGEGVRVREIFLYFAELCSASITTSPPPTAPEQPRISNLAS